MKEDRNGGRKDMKIERGEEPGREMEGDTVMTMNTRNNSNQKEPISLKKTTFSILQFLFYRYREERSYGRRYVASVFCVG